MLRIITENGRDLDLKQGMEIEFEMVNPIFEKDFAPVTFSTNIQFPPSDANKEIFGYLPAIKMEPRIKELPCYIQLDGAVIYHGKLCFDGIDEDGYLEYIFTENTLSIQEIGCKTFIDNNVTSRYFPLMVKQQETAHSIFSEEGTTVSENIEQVDPEIKYYNHIHSNTPQTTLVPCALISKILESAGIDYEQGSFLESAAIIAWDDEKSVADTIQEICKLFCARIFKDGASFIIKPLQDILECSSARDWSKIVSDKFSSQSLKAEPYTIAYENNQKAASPSAVAGTYTSIEDMVSTRISDYVSGRYRTRNYKCVKVNHANFKAYYSVIVHFIKSGTEYGEILTDFLGYEKNASAGREGETLSIGMHLVECTIINEQFGILNNRPNMLAPIIPSSPSGIYIGRLYPIPTMDQLVDGTYPSVKSSSIDTCVGESLDTESIYNKYHQAFGSYVSENRQILIADVNLSSLELGQFRMWDPIIFANRKWLVKKLTITVDAVHGIQNSKGEFVSL